MSTAVIVVIMAVMALFGAAPTLQAEEDERRGRPPAIGAQESIERGGNVFADRGRQSDVVKGSQLSIAEAICGALLLFGAGSIFYVYRLRGTVRYPSFARFFRKSWPIFAPFNCFLYLSTLKRARGPVLSADIVTDLAPLRSNWQVIRDEALALHAAGGLESSATPGSPGYYDVGFRTFFKYGWRKFYLCWYGYTHPSALRLCPRTSELLASTASINGAMFSFLPPGSELTQHSDPLACSLRYHLGLATPEHRDCFIEVDGVRRAWFDGQDFLFDETYPHFAQNRTEHPRLILMCDVERPMFCGGRLFNGLYRGLAKLTVVPNTNEDRRGFASATFASIAPLLQRSKELKLTNPVWYRILKVTVNTVLLGMLLLLLLAGASFVEWLLRF